MQSLGGSAQLGTVSAGLQVGLGEGRGGTAQPTSPVKHFMFEFRECPIFHLQMILPCIVVVRIFLKLRKCYEHAATIYFHGLLYLQYMTASSRADEKRMRRVQPKPSPFRCNEMMKIQKQQKQTPRREL